MNNYKVWFKRSLKASSLFIVLLVAFWIIPKINPNVDSYSDLLTDYVLDKGAVGILIFVLATSISLCFAVPRQIVSFLAGYTFGAYFGLIWSCLASLISCILAFTYARFIARDYVQKRFAKRINKVDSLLCAKPFSTTLIIRLLPVGNNLVTCLLAGLTKMPSLPFFIASTLGYIPQNLIFSLLGSGINVSSAERTIVSIVLFVISSLLGAYLFMKYKNSPITEENNE